MFSHEGRFPLHISTHVETNLPITVSQRSNDFQDIKTSTTQLHIVPNSRIAKWHIAIQPTLLIQLVLFGYSERGYFSVSVSINVLYYIIFGYVNAP